MTIGESINTKEIIEKLLNSEPEYAKQVELEYQEELNLRRKLQAHCIENISYSGLMEVVSTIINGEDLICYSLKGYRYNTYDNTVNLLMLIKSMCSDIYKSPELYNVMVGDKIGYSLIIHTELGDIKWTEVCDQQQTWIITRASNNDLIESRSAGKESIDLKTLLSEAQASVI